MTSWRHVLSIAWLVAALVSTTLFTFTHATMVVSDNVGASLIGLALYLLLFGWILAARWMHPRRARRADLKDEEAP